MSVSSYNLNSLKTPILENGDLLSRAEFERRYQRMPSLKKAELIEGIVYTGHHVRHNGASL